MDYIPSNWLIPAGAVVAALIAGLFSFFNLILSKEQKLSELRQGWIDGLREDLAAFFSALYAIEYLEGVYQHEHGDALNYVELAKATHGPHMKVSETFARIMLRLNPSDQFVAQSNLVVELNKIKDAFNDSKYEDATNCIPEARNQARLVLKAEWERVKQGEPTFRWSKRIALIVLLNAIGLGVYLAIQTTSLTTGHMEISDSTTVTTHSNPNPPANAGIEPTH